MREKGKLIFVLSLFIYAVLGILLLPFYQYLINSDGISYLSIAQKYLLGDFKNAVNGYWGPLYSILLVPFLSFKLPPLLAVKFLSLILGLVTMAGVRLLSYRFKISEEARNILSIALIPIMLDFSLTWITSDLLLLCILIYYLYFIFDPEYPLKLSNGIICGALGAAAYFAKIYALPFFIVHFSLFNLIHYFKDRLKLRGTNTLRNFSLGMFIFLFISGFWVFMLSNKYKEFTIGTTGRFIYAAAGPKYNLFSPISISSLGFLKPPNETAISIWEDPSCVRLESWSPMQSRNSFLYQLKLSSKNIYTVSHYMLQKVSLFSALIIFAYILFCIMPLQSLISESIGLYPLLTVVLYPLGYLIVAVVDRHLWLVCILLLLMGAELLTMLLRSNFFIGAKKEVTKAVFVLSFLLLPFYNLILNFNGGRDIYTLSRVLSSYGIRGNVVSNKTDAPTNKNWHMTLYLSYYLGNHYYGEVPGKTSDKEPQGLFLQNNIDYYFFWGKASDAPEFLFKYKEKTGAKFPGLRIYSLKERA